MTKNSNKFVQQLTSYPKNLFSKIEIFDGVIIARKKIEIFGLFQKKVHVLTPPSPPVCIFSGIAHWALRWWLASQPIFRFLKNVFCFIGSSYKSLINYVLRMKHDQKVDVMKFLNFKTDSKIDGYTFAEVLWKYAQK